MRNRSEVNKFLHDGSRNSFLSAFSPINPHKPILVSGITETHFSFDIEIENGTLEKKELLAKSLGHPTFRVVNKPGELCSVLQVSKANPLPTNIKFGDIYNAIKNNTKKGLFAGMGPFGPEFVKFNFVHAAVVGSTGFGKSTFFRSLMLQSILFHEETVNHIVDPKCVDFETLRKAPGVGLTVSNTGDFISLLDCLIVELNARKELYSKWTSPPDSLESYNELRTRGMPKLPRIIVWVDEFKIIGGSNLRYAIDPRIDYLSRLGRAFGIHFMLSSQELHDYSECRKSIGTWFVFYLNGSFGINVEGEFTRDYQKPTKGFLNIVGEVDGEEKIRSCQSPMVTTSEMEALVLLASKSKRKSFPNHGFIKLAMERDFMTNRLIGALLCEGHTLKSIICNELPDSTVQRTGTPFGRFGEDRTMIKLHDIVSRKKEDTLSELEINSELNLIRNLIRNEGRR